MTPIQKRIAALEAKKPAVVPAWHRIVVAANGTLDDAVACYGAERIAPHDGMIIRTVVDAPDIPRSPARLEVVR